MSCYTGFGGYSCEAWPFLKGGGSGREGRWGGRDWGKGGKGKWVIDVIYERGIKKELFWKNCIIIQCIKKIAALLLSR